MMVNMFTLSQELILVSLLVAAILSLSIWTTSRFGMKKSRRLASFRWTNVSFLSLGLSWLLLALLSGPVPAKELFAIPSNDGLEFYQLDGTIQGEESSVKNTNPTVWPGLESKGLNDTFTFSDLKVQKTSLTMDPGFRTSLSNRIITVAGQIAWDSGDTIQWLQSFRGKEDFDIAKLNRERLTGVYEIAMGSSHEPRVSGYN